MTARVTVALAALLSGAAAAPLNETYRLRAASEADRLLTCNYIKLTGSFDFEGLWQSGNTLETLALYGMLGGAGGGGRDANLSARIADAFTDSYARQPVIVDQCFDDHQWWGLAFVRAYALTGNASYFARAAAVFEYVRAHGWETSLCGGGVTWCPAPTSPYKNAITSDLFLSLSMSLARYAAAAGAPQPASYYQSWGATAWRWLASSGIINGQSLLNDGLNSTCDNNGQTTWTYNNGVLLEALAALEGSDASAGAAATAISAAVRAHLSGADGVLAEPCGGGGCDGDQQLFKGIFMRHLRAMVGAGSGAAPARDAAALAFIARNAASLLATAACDGGGYGLAWDAPCASSTTATSSSALDLLVAAAALPVGADAAAWQPLGLGNCADAAGAAMPSCSAAGCNEARCAFTAAEIVGAVAYDHHISCIGDTVCRVRTLAGAAACPAGWAFTPGAATNVTQTNNQSLTICVVRAAA